MVKEIDINSKKFKHEIEEIACIGNLHKLSIRFQGPGDAEPKRLDLSYPPPVIATSIPGRAATTSVPLHPNDQIYLAASYTKVVLNMLMVLVAQKHGIKLDENACGIYNDVRGPNLPKLTLQRNPTFRQLLSHINGFPPMNGTIFAADGTCLLTREEFLHVAMLEDAESYKMDEHMQTSAKYMYSNANHIFAAIIIELVTKKSIDTVADEMLFQPLGMNQSTLVLSRSRSLENMTGMISGYQVSSSNEQIPMSTHNLLQDIVGIAPMGLRSSPDDIAKFNSVLIAAVFGNNSYCISEADAKEFLAGSFKSLAGLVTKVPKKKPTLQDFKSESPNIYLDQETHQYQEISSVKKYREKLKPNAYKFNGLTQDICLYNQAHQKSGYFDGYSCSVLLIPDCKIFLIVMGDSTGPLDTVHYITWYLMQELFAVKNRVDVLTEATKARERCSRALAELERKNLLMWNTAGPLPRLAGVYENDVNRQRITISQNGDVFFHGNTSPTLDASGDVSFPEGSKRSSAMKTAQLGENCFRVLLDRKVLTLEGWSTWANMDIEVQRDRSDVLLFRQFETSGKVHKHTYKRITDWTKPEVNC